MADPLKLKDIANEYKPVVVDTCGLISWLEGSEKVTDKLFDRVNAQRMVSRMLGDSSKLYLPYFKDLNSSLFVTDGVLGEFGGNLEGFRGSAQSVHDAIHIAERKGYEVREGKEVRGLDLASVSRREAIEQIKEDLRQRRRICKALVENRKVIQTQGILEELPSDARGIIYGFGNDASEVDKRLVAAAYKASSEGRRPAILTTDMVHVVGLAGALVTKRVTKRGDLVVFAREKKNQFLRWI